MDHGAGASFGRPDPTGRSSGRHSGRRKRLAEAPKGKPWVWMTRELISSDAWRCASLHCRKLIDFLCVENMNHAGLENGLLKATYDQLEAWGIPRRRICAAINEAEFLGLVRCERGVRWSGTGKPSLFRLTWLPTMHDEKSPTNEWKATTKEAVEAWRSQQRLLEKKKRPPARGWNPRVIQGAKI